MAEAKRPTCVEPTLEQLEAWLAENPWAQRIVAGILGDLNPPKEKMNDVREAILRELDRNGAL